MRGGGLPSSPQLHGAWIYIDGLAFRGHCYNTRLIFTTNTEMSKKTKTFRGCSFSVRVYPVCQKLDKASRGNVLMIIMLTKQ